MDNTGSEVLLLACGSVVHPIPAAGSAVNKRPAQGWVTDGDIPVLGFLLTG